MTLSKRSTINPLQLHDVNIRAAEAGERRRTGNLDGSNQVDPVESYCEENDSN